MSKPVRFARLLPYSVLRAVMVRESTLITIAYAFTVVRVTVRIKVGVSTLGLGLSWG